MAQESGPAIARTEIDGLKAALNAPKGESSEARKRLAFKRVIRDGGELLKANGGAPNRFEVLGVLFAAQQQLFGLDDSARNREALLETCQALVKAPDLYAEIRLDADLLLTQTEMARKGANAEARVAALKPMVSRYRNTPAEAKMLRIAMVMALELGDSRLISDLREEIAERFAGDHEMIIFQREKLGGQVFGAPFCGTFQCNDGSVRQFPADGLGRTTALYFWSQEEGGNKDLEELAGKWKEMKGELAGRISIVSFNVDELPDAGEKILRDLGVDWPALHLPGGRGSSTYQAFAKRDPAIVTLSPTGYAALIMSGATRKVSGTTEALDYERWFNSSLARQWTKPRYVNQLGSLFAGDFLVLDVGGDFEPTLPPEIKATHQPVKLARSESSVPEETLRAIQDSFVRPPVRYRLGIEEIRASYLKVDELCRKAIAAYPGAPDLWIVRNRRVIAQLGLWKVTADQSHFDLALEEARAALAAGMPPGTEVVARFCLAKEALRLPKNDAKKVIRDFVETMGGDTAPPPTFAAAALLALDLGERGIHEEYRAIIFKNHFEHPMMATFVTFLLDRYQRYQLFQVPFTAGWSYGRREDYFLSIGEPEEVSRSFAGELKTFEGESFSIPKDTSGKWTVVFLSHNWAKQDRPSQPSMAKMMATYAENRPFKDLQTVMAVVDDEVETLRALLLEKPLDVPVLVVPNGLRNPIVNQLGVVSEDEAPNALVLRPDGSIAAMLSGTTMQGKARGRVIQNLIEWQDEQNVIAALAKGEIEKAKEIAFALAPVFDPEAVDEKGRKFKKPKISDAHLRARARVYMAMKNWEAALADAEEVLSSQTATDGGMSLRTKELDEIETLCDEIRKKQVEAAK